MNNVLKCVSYILPNSPPNSPPHFPTHLPTHLTTHLPTHLPIPLLFFLCYWYLPHFYGFPSRADDSFPSFLNVQSLFFIFYNSFSVYIDAPLTVPPLTVPPLETSDENPVTDTATGSS